MAGKLQVTVVVEGGCCQDVIVVDDNGEPVDFDLTIEDHDEEKHG